MKVCELFEAIDTIDKALKALEIDHPTKAKDAYRRLSKKWHPDHHETKASRGEAESKFKDVTAAWRFIRSNPEAVKNITPAKTKPATKTTPTGRHRGVDAYARNSAAPKNSYGYA